MNKERERAMQVMQRWNSKRRPRSKSPANTAKENVNQLYRANVDKKLLLSSMKIYYSQALDKTSPLFIRKFLKNKALTKTARIYDYANRHFGSGLVNRFFNPNVTIMDVLLECVRVGEDDATPIIETYVNPTDDEKDTIHSIIEEIEEELQDKETPRWFINICLLLALPTLTEKKIKDDEKQGKSGGKRILTILIADKLLNTTLTTIVRSSGLLQAYVNPTAILSEVTQNFIGVNLGQATSYIDAADFFHKYIGFTSYVISGAVVDHVSQWRRPSELKQLTYKLQQKRRYKMLERSVTAALWGALVSVLLSPKMRTWLTKNIQSRAGIALHQFHEAAELLAKKIGIQREVSSLTKEQLDILDQHLKEINPSMFAALQRWVRNNLPSILDVFPEPEQDQDDDNKNA